MIKLTLNVKERLLIANLLPKESNLSEQLIGKSILDKTFITIKEREKLIYDPLYQGEIRPDTDFEADFELTKEEHELLYNDVLQKDKEKKITPYIVSLAIKVRDAKTLPDIKKKE